MAPLPPLQRRTATILIALALAAVATTPAASAEGATDIVLVIGPSGSVNATDPAGRITAQNVTEGARYAWTLNLTANHTIAEVSVQGALNLTRPRQAVPLLDGKHFVPVGFDVSEVDTPAQVYNLHGTADNLTYRLGLPGPRANATLTLAVDTAPPAYGLDAPDRVTDRSFFLTSRTTESALARLFIRPAAGGDLVEHRTPSPALTQSFPVQGLKPDTLYAYHLEFEDWSGNTATTATEEVRTKPEPERPLPLITTVAPPRNATVPANQLTVRATFESPDSPVAREGVRLFFDKEEVLTGLVVDGTTLEYTPPGDLDVRRYFASVEVTNLDGGKAMRQWSFNVTDAAEVASVDTPAPGVPVAALALALALAVGPRRRGGSGGRGP